MRRVSSLPSSDAASVVSATGDSSADSVVHAAGNLGSTTVRVSWARSDPAAINSAATVNRERQIPR